jgi:PAS domain S-box-containing protein
MNEKEFTDEVKVRKAFFNITDKDSETLRKVGKILDGQIDKIIDSLYEHLMKFDETKVFFPDRATLERVKNLQKNYLKKLTKGDYDEEYFKNRLKIGETHSRTNLAIKWYLGAYSKYHQIVLPMIAEKLGCKHREVIDSLISLVKIMLLDMSLAVDAYVESRERDIKDAKKRLETLFNSVEDYILVIDPEYRIVDANPAALSFSKCSREELIGRHCYEVNHMEEHPCKPPTVCTLKEVLKKGESIRLEHVHYDGEGKPHYIELIGSPIRDHEGNIIQLVEICRDITDRVEMYEKVKESEEKYRTLVESSTDGIVIHQRGKIVYANAAAYKIMGYEPGEFTDKSVLDFIHPDFRKTAEEQIKKILEKGESAPPIEEKFLRKDGTIIDVEVAAAPIKYGGKPAVQVIFHDISQRKKIESELRRRVDELERMHKAFVGRELRMAELKREIKELKKKLEKEHEPK